MIHLLNVSLNVCNKQYLVASISSILTKYSGQDTTFTDDNYRLNNNILRVAFTENFTIANAIGKHTVVHEIGNDYKRVYNVLKYDIQSGYIEYTLQVDLWHTYIYDADIRNIRVTKSTQDLQVNGVNCGFYTPPREPLSTPKYIPFDVKEGGSSIVLYDNLIDMSKFYIVIAIKYNNYKSQSGSVSTSRLYAVNLKTLSQFIKEEADDAGYNFGIYAWQTVIADFISGIYEIYQKINGNITYQTECEIINAWIIDGAMLHLQDQLFASYQYYLHFRIGALDLAIKPVWVCANDGSNESYKRELVFDEAKPNCKYYAGTANNYIEIGAGWYENKIEFRAITGNDDLKVVLIYGDNQKDITSAFSLNFTSVAGDVSQQKQIVDQLQTALPIIASTSTIAMGVVTENPIAIGGGILSLANASVTAMEKNLPHRTGINIRAGDAYSTYGSYFIILQAYKVQNPYFIIEIEDEITGVDDFEYYGLVYDVIYDTLNNVVTSRDVISGTYVAGTLDGCIYLQASDMTFNGNIPLEAQEYIYSKLLSGIRIIQ